MLRLRTLRGCGTRERAFATGLGPFPFSFPLFLFFLGGMGGELLNHTMHMSQYVLCFAFLQAKRCHKTFVSDKPSGTTVGLTSCTLAG